MSFLPDIDEGSEPKLFAGRTCISGRFCVRFTYAGIDPKWSISWMEVYNGAGVRDLSLEIQERPEGWWVVPVLVRFFKPEHRKDCSEYVSLLETSWQIQARNCQNLPVKFYRKGE